MRLQKAGLVLALMVGLSACVIGGGKEEPAAKPAANPIMGDAIATTSLDAPGVVAVEAATPPAVAQPEPAAPATKPTPVPAGTGALTVKTPPPAPKSPAEAACLKSGGNWVTAGKGGAKSCVSRTRDGGKSCNKQSDCEGLCLSRSRSCAPIKPMFGCNDILQNDGREVTLCID